MTSDKPRNKRFMTDLSRPEDPYNALHLYDRDADGASNNRELRSIFHMLKLSEICRVRGDVDYILSAASVAWPVVWP